MSFTEILNAALARKAEVRQPLVQAFHDRDLSNCEKPFTFDYSHLAVTAGSGAPVSTSTEYMLPKDCDRITFKADVLNSDGATTGTVRFTVDGTDVGTISILAGETGLTEKTVTFALTTAGTRQVLLVEVWRDTGAGSVSASTPSGTAAGSPIHATSHSGVATLHADFPILPSGDIAAGAAFDFDLAEALWERDQANSLKPFDLAYAGQTTTGDGYANRLTLLDVQRVVPRDGKTLRLVADVYTGDGSTTGILGMDLNSGDVQVGVAIPAAYSAPGVEITLDLDLGAHVGTLIRLEVAIYRTAGSALVASGAPGVISYTFHP